MSPRHLLHDLQISSRVPAAVMLIIFLSYTALVAAAVGIAEHMLSKRLAEEPVPWVVGLVALCTLSVSVLVLQLSNRLEDLRLLQRMNFKYWPSGGVDRPESTATMYDAARRIIRGVREDGTCEILAVNSFHEPFDPLDDNNSHRKYFEALDEKLEKVSYQRLVQCETKEQLAENLARARDYCEHFKHAISLRDSRRHDDSAPQIRLDMVKPTFPITFVIVKHTNGAAYLIWQLNEYTGTVRDNRHVFRARGLLIVTDPDKHLIRYFEGWFHRLASASPHQITQDYLP